MTLIYKFMIYYDISKYIDISSILNYIVWIDIFRYINCIYLLNNIDILQYINFWDISKIIEIYRYFWYFVFQNIMIYRNFDISKYIISRYIAIYLDISLDISIYWFSAQNIPCIPISWWRYIIWFSEYYGRSGVRKFFF